MQIIELDQIKKIIPTIDLMPAIEQAFVAYSMGKAIVPPVGELLFQNPPGDVHIKYGYIQEENYYVIKIASGFYDNPKINLSSSNGLMLLFSQKTGVLAAILLDQGYLTDLRTAVAGAIAAKYLAPRQVKKIGIVGTGIQAREQLRFLKNVTHCREVIVYGRNSEKLSQFEIEMKQEGFICELTQKMEVLTASCNLIVTTTPSKTPLLWASQIKPGTHITAVGTDTPIKQEIDPHLFGKADIVVVDSISQCIERGDAAHALRENIISKAQLIELGFVILDPKKGRTNEDQITIADLTGIATQDIQIATAVFESGLLHPDQTRRV